MIALSSLQQPVSLRTLTQRETVYLFRAQTGLVIYSLNHSVSQPVTY